MAAFRDDCYAKTSTDDVGGAIWARCGEKAHKFSLIYACSKLLDRIHRRTPLIIDREATEWACKLARWNTERMSFLAGRWVSSSQFEDQQKKLTRFAASKGGRITRREVMRKFGLDRRDTTRLLDCDVRSRAFGEGKDCPIEPDVVQGTLRDCRSLEKRPTALDTRAAPAIGTLKD